MEIKTVWAVYFSGTGTTEKVATHLARSLAGQLGAQYKSHDYTQPKAGKTRYSSVRMNWWYWVLRSMPGESPT